jgi:CRP/FNR family transcriptional regulator, cyclic AMP receptor protein
MTADDFLMQVPLFARLSPSELDGLRVVVRPHRYAAGEIIFHEGDEGTALYIVEKGEVKIVRGSAEGKEVLLGSLLGPGDFFGELALFDGEPRSANAVAKEISDLLILERQDFRRFVAEHPQVALNLLQVLSRRLRRTDELLADAAFLDVRARLVKRLLDLTKTSVQPGPPGSVVIASRLTQSELADMVGTTRESINKALQYYIKKGWLRRERGRLTLLDLTRLREDVS